MSVGILASLDVLSICVMIKNKLINYTLVFSTVFKMHFQIDTLITLTCNIKKYNETQMGRQTSLQNDINLKP